jgi:hypothetical protein
MTRKRLAVLVSIATLSFLLGITYWEYCRPVDIELGPIGPESLLLGISDPEYIRLAKTTAEVQAFLQKYPNAQVAVDRSGSLAVDVWVSPPGATHIDHLRLRVLIDPRRHRPTKRFIVCGGGRLVQQHLLEFLQTERCLP